jgi:hypothetical protein
MLKFVRNLEDPKVNDSETDTLQNLIDTATARGFTGFRYPDKFGDFEKPEMDDEGGQEGSVELTDDDNNDSDSEQEMESSHCVCM